MAYRVFSVDENKLIVDPRPMVVEKKLVNRKMILEQALFIDA
jgi:hypothetical protein